MKRISLFFIIFLLSLPVQAEWKRIANGIDTLHEEKGSVHLFRIDPQLYRFTVLLASDYQLAALTTKRYQERSGAPVVMNGGFFDEVFHSLGLLQREGTTLNPLRKVAWGIFLLGGDSGREPSIVHRKEWRPEGVSMAIQAGPRLLVRGKIQSFKEAGVSKRSAVGIAEDGRVVLAVAEAPLLLREWAEVLQRHCLDALNLDGGGSSQFSARFANFSLDVEGATGVPNAVAIFPY